MSLELDELCVGYRRRVVLGPVSQGLEPGTLTALVGPNGAGKSTLLRSLAGLQSPLSGRVLVRGVDAAQLGRRELARQLAVVLTDRIQVEHLRVDHLVELGRHPHQGLGSRSSEVDRAVVRAALERVGAGHLSSRLFSQLSDGQRQRVLIARALAQQPGVMLLDEPTSFLDPAGRIGIWLLLARLAHDEGLAVLVSTHEVELALHHCDRLWVADAGRVVAGSCDELVASGQLASPFETAEVRFNPLLGRFEEAS